MTKGSEEERRKTLQIYWEYEDEQRMKDMERDDARAPQPPLRLKDPGK